jgi:predicted  nucleic acid-binding Zn-ribbon protein
MNPLVALKKESDSIRSVIRTVDENVQSLKDKQTELLEQKETLSLVVQAIENEMDRIRIANPIVEQLEFVIDND